MPTSKSKGKKKVVKAYQVVDSIMLKRDKKIMGLIFSPSLQSFSEAIYLFKIPAQRYADALNKGARIFKVIPIEITYKVALKDK
jgi:hypothetical protein